MRLIKFETQGESHTAVVNPDHVAYLAEGIYGTSIHFASGEYIICHGEIDEVAVRLAAAGASGDDYLIASPVADAKPG